MRLRFTQQEGLQFEGVGLSIDAKRPQEIGIISHAHTDHSARHKKIICTPETALLLGERWKSLSTRAVPYGQPLALEDAKITFHPAGHILGSAMVLIERESMRVLYSGDFRTVDSDLFSGARPVACDVLVMEATFAQPEYRFPTAARAKQMLHAFVDAARSSKHTPVLTGYALGKAQELVALLADYHESIWVHPKIAAFCELYRRAGVKLPPVEIPAAGAPPGALVVMPPNFARSEWRALVSRPRVCFCSGWAMSHAGGGWYACDQAIPISDHADCESLVSFAKATGARKVYTLHGFASELAELLRSEGIDAQVAPEGWQAETASAEAQLTAETLDLFRA